MLRQMVSVPYGDEDEVMRFGVQIGHISGSNQDHARLYASMQDDCALADSLGYGRYERTSERKI